MSNDVQRFIIVDELFSRYTVVVDIADRTTTVYCTECEQWVIQWPGEQVSCNTHIELLEKIVDAHRPQVMGEEVGFESEDLSGSGV